MCSPLRAESHAFALERELPCGRREHTHLKETPMNGATMRVREIMSTEVKTIQPDEPAWLALEKMRSEGIHHLVVMDGRSVVGVASTRDLAEARTGEAWKGLRVSELMAHAPVCVKPDLPVKRAANLLRGRSIGCLPVVDGGKLVAIVTRSGLLTLVGPVMKSC